MIRVRYMGQLGNQMFQYVIGKILAEKTGQAYFPDRWRNKAGAPLAWHREPYLIPTSSMGCRTGEGPLVIDCQHWFDIGNVFPGWSIEATGFFQCYELLAPYRDAIRRDWLPIRTPFMKTDDDAIYIHVRRTDYLGDDLTPERNCQATKLEEYEACVRRFSGIAKAVLVTDDCTDIFIHSLSKMLWDKFKIAATWQRFTPWDDDFLTLASCRNLIMSQSTFSWWAAFLGRATKIVCPVFPGTFWGNGYRQEKCDKYPNLEVADDPGKEWIWLHE